MELKEAREVVEKIRQRKKSDAMWYDTQATQAAVILDDRVTELEGLANKFGKTIQHIQHEGNIYQKRVEELEAQRDELLEALKDILEAFWDMSPLEYAASRGLPCMSDGEGERVLEKARQTIRGIK